jgi:nitroreductase
MAVDPTLADVIMTRRSIRAYATERVDRKLIEELMQLVRLAPSARNRQEWGFVVADDPSVISRIAREGSTSPFVSGSPVVIAAVATDPEYVMRCGADASDVDLSIALDHLQLLAWSAGLGSCWLGSFDERAVAGVIGIPDDCRIVGLMTLGYPAEQPEGRPRKTLEQFCCFNAWSI